jgi:sporulation protein YlmC with PRC-barrel domain
MKRTIAIAVSVSAVLLSAISASQSQQVVGSTQLGVAVAELRDVTVGWSARRQILGQLIYNDKGEAVGKADDIIIAPDKAVSYAIIGAGGFLGVGKHDVAVPVSQLKESDGKIILAGATKDAIKAMPAFEYAR